MSFGGNRRRMVPRLMDEKIGKQAPFTSQPASHVTPPRVLACSKRSDSGERCEVKILPRFYFFALLFSSHRSPLSERLEQATRVQVALSSYFSPSMNPDEPHT